MDIAFFLSNPWVVGTGVTVVGGLILYYGFGVGRGKKEGKINYDNSPHISAGGDVSAGRDIVVGNLVTKEKKVKSGSISVDFEEKKISWANYAVGRWAWSSFRMVLSVNNFRNKSPEYLKAYLVAGSSGGGWKGENFMFQNREDERKSAPNEDYRIEPGYKEKVSLFISSYDVGDREQRPMPDIDRDTMKLVVETESGKKFTLPIKPGWISRG